MPGKTTTAFVPDSHVCRSDARTPMEIAMNTTSTRSSALRNNARRILRAGALALSLVMPAAASAETLSDNWTFVLTPYLWLPTIHGTLNYSIPPGGTGSPSTEVGPNSYVADLNFAFMVAGEARKGEWSIFTDVIYLNVSSQDSTVKAVNFTGPAGVVSIGTSANASTSSSVKGTIWTLGGGYSVVHTPAVTLDVIGGFRYFGLEASTDWQLAATVTGPLGGTQVFPKAGSISQRENVVDAIVGIRGRVKLGESNWSIPYYLDAGTGSSKLTWQALLGISYSLSWGNVELAYRHLSYDEKSDKLVQDMRFSGPALGISFRF